MMPMTGKVAIVTGGASGVGRATVETLARQGARVVVADLDLDRAEDVARGVDGAAIRVDVSPEADVRTMVEETCARFGGVDVLINNAGIGFSASSRHKMASVVDTPVEAWDAIVGINLRSVALGCKHVIPRMRERGGGSIVNNASIQAIAGVSGADAYTAAKGGIVSLTRVLACDWGPSNVRVNCVCPGPVSTPMIAELLLEPEFLGAMIAPVPLGRVAAPEEIAEVIAFLAGPGASYVNGAILPVDGGWSAR